MSILYLLFALTACGGVLREHLREYLPCGGHMVLFVGRVATLQAIAVKSQATALLHAIANAPEDSIVTACIPDDFKSEPPNP